jgi:hypothetical protein
MALDREAAHSAISAAAGRLTAGSTGAVYVSDRSNARVVTSKARRHRPCFRFTWTDPKAARSTPQATSTSWTGAAQAAGQETQTVLTISESGIGQAQGLAVDAKGTVHIGGLGNQQVIALERVH